VEETHAARVGCDEKLFESGLGSTLKPLRSLTGRLYDHLTGDDCFRFLAYISSFIEHHDLERCLVTVDGTYYRIPEPSSFDTRYNLHKFNGLGLRYEIAVCIRTGKIFFYNGPFECGRWPDLNIFRNKLKGMITVGQKVVADNGYKGDDKF
jgi:hypothetical protein